MANAHVIVKRDTRYPEGSHGAWEAQLYYGEDRIARFDLAKTRDDAIGQAQRHWDAIRDEYLANPAPQSERLELN